MEALALNLVELWTQLVGPVLLFVIGIGLVVFVHELGHFLAAKWVGIKVECFALGFGPRLIGIKRGETDYCINAFPLGGYIKMLGQEDFAPLCEDETPDPRSYQAKSVGARLCVIAAGVVMNVIAAAILFIFVGLVGKNFTAPVVGSIHPDYPADKVALDWQPASVGSSQLTQPQTRPAFGPGLKPGDTILQVDGRKVTRFQDLQMKSVLAFDENETFEIVISRIDQKHRKWIGKGNLAVKKSPDGTMLIFGIIPAPDTIFGEIKDLLTESPFDKGDRLLAIDGQEIKHYWQIARLEDTLSGEAVTVTIERRSKDSAPEIIDVQVQPTLSSKAEVIWLKDGSRAQLLGTDVDKDDKSKALLRVKLSDGSERAIEEDAIAGGGLVEPLDILGMIPRFRVLAVKKDSPAHKADMKVGDIILAYGDHGTPTLRKFHEISDRIVGSKTQIVVLRDGERQTIAIAPEKTRNGNAIIGVSPGVDLMHAVVADVREGSPAQKLGLMGGDVIEKINNRKVKTWIDVFGVLKDVSGKKVTIAYKRGVQEHKVDLDGLDASAFDPQDYRVSLFPTESFNPLVVRIVKRNPISAVIWGAGETQDFILRTYATLRALIRNTVSTKTLIGPVGIGKIAVSVAREQPLIDFVYLMAFISATLAVINFLPLPVVDGGHAVFLLIEKLRGKPVPVKIMNIVQFTGLALLATVFVLLTWQDISNWISNG